MANVAASKCGTKEIGRSRKERKASSLESQRCMVWTGTRRPGGISGISMCFLFLVLFLFSLCERVSVSVHCSLR